MNQTSDPTGESLTASGTFWNKVRYRLSLESDADLARRIGIDPAAFSRARNAPVLFKGSVSAEKQQRLLEELAKTFSQIDQMQVWLAKSGWEVTAEQAAWLERYFQLRGRQRLLRQLTAAYEPRPDLEAQVMAYLRPSQRPLDQELIARAGVVLTGVRGQGKTALALGVLRAHPALEDEFPDGVYFLECHRLTTMQCLESLAVEVGVDLTGLAAEQHAATLRRRLKDKALLLVVDDVEEVATLRQCYNVLGSCSVSRLLITTYQHLAESELAALRLRQLEVPDLTAPEGQRLVERLLHHPIASAEQVDFEQLLRRISGHPLALTILSGLKDETQGTWADLLRTLEQAPLAALEHAEATDKEDNVRLCFELVYQRLLERQPQAAAVFRALGVFAGPRGTIGLLGEIAELRELVETTLHQLVRYHLLAIEPVEADSQRVWHTHPLLCDFARLKLREQPEEELACQRRYLQALVATAQHLQLAYHTHPVTYLHLRAVRDDLLHAAQLAAHLSEWTALFSLVNFGVEVLSLAGWVDPLLALLEHLAVGDGTGAYLLKAQIATWHGQREMARHRPDRALEYFDQALQFDSSRSRLIPTLLKVAACYLRLDQRDAAAQAMARATVAALWNMSYLSLQLAAGICAGRAEVLVAFGHFTWAMQEFARAEATYAQIGWNLNVAQIQISRATCLLDANQPVAEALTLLDQARQFFSDQNWPLEYVENVALGYCYAFLRQQNFVAAQAELDRWEQALNDFAIDDWPHLYAKLRQWRGTLAEDQRQYAVALVHYQQSLALWQQVPVSESTQQIIRERMAIVQAHMAERPAVDTVS